MSSLLRAGLLAVMVVAGFGANAAAPSENLTLNVNVSVSVPHVMRIIWATGSSAVGGTPLAPVGGTTTPVVWDIGSQDFEATVLMSAGQPPVLPAYTLNIKNAGTAKIDIQAKIGADTGTANKKWAIGATPATDVCAVKAGALQLTTADQELAADLKRSDTAVSANIEFKTPTDSDFLSNDTGVHAFLITFTATAP